jgi:hypothetical protein
MTLITRRVDVHEEADAEEHAEGTDDRGDRSDEGHARREESAEDHEHDHERDRQRDRLAAGQVVL